MEKKSNVGLWLLIIILLIGLTGCQKKEEKVEEKKEEPKPELIYLDNYMNMKEQSGLWGIYSDGSAKLLSKDVASVHYTIDGNTIYYTLRGDLYSLDISKEGAEPKKYDISIEQAFSVTDGKLNYIIKAEGEQGKYVANSVDLNGGAEEKEILKLNAAHVDAEIVGDIAYFDDSYHVSVPKYIYAYNFKTKELTKIGNYDYVLENQVDHLLVKKGKNDYCIIDKKTNKETFCQKMVQPGNNVYDTFPTSHNGNIIILEDGKIKECTGANNCEKELYTLTDAEKKSPSLTMRYIGEHLFLTVGENETCREGCTYDYATYDILNDHKKMDYYINVEGYGQGIYLK